MYHISHCQPCQTAVHAGQTGQFAWFLNNRRWRKRGRRHQPKKQPNPSKCAEYAVLRLYFEFRRLRAEEEEEKEPRMAGDGNGNSPPTPLTLNRPDTHTHAHHLGLLQASRS